MPKYLKLGQNGNIIKFKVICDDLGDGQPVHVEEQIYVLGAHPDFKDETEDELMSRVAHHINDGIKASKSSGLPEEIESAPEKEAVSKVELFRLKEERIEAAEAELVSK